MSRLRIWTCKDGKRIAIKDMETSHIRNTRALLERKAKELTGIEIAYLGDEMFDEFEQDGYDVPVYSTPIYQWLDDFDKELERRGARHEHG
jgi:hypothetical protein